MKKCKRGVKDGQGGFKACGKKAIERVLMGIKVCYYCEEHAKQAIRYKERVGNSSIVETQKKWIDFRLAQIPESDGS